MSNADFTPPIEGSDLLDNPLRVLIVVNSPTRPDGDMEEILLDSIQSFDDMNEFFDKFDESVAIPNEDHIKYEVGSDGLVVIVVDSLELRDTALKFMEEYISHEGTTDEANGTNTAKKAKTKGNS